jgi:hypothetical protein
MGKMIKLLTGFTFVVVLLLGAFGLAQAAPLTVVYGEAPTVLIDPSKPAFYVEETVTATGGAYKIFNNTTDYVLVGFGMTTPYTTNAFANEVTRSDDADGGMWEALILSSTNWTDPIPYHSSPDPNAEPSAQNLFGNIGDVLGSEGYANYYYARDANPLSGGVSAWGFEFTGTPDSRLFGVTYGPNGPFTFYTPATGVPEPSLMLLLCLGLAGVSIFRQSRKL